MKRLLLVLFPALLAMASLAFAATEGSQDQSWIEGKWKNQTGDFSMEIKSLKAGQIAGTVWTFSPEGKPTQGTIQEGTFAEDSLKFKASFLRVGKTKALGTKDYEFQKMPNEMLSGGAVGGRKMRMIKE